MTTAHDIEKIHSYIGPFFLHAPMVLFCFDDDGNVITASDHASQRMKQILGREFVGFNIIESKLISNQLIEAVKGHKPMRNILHLNLRTMKNEDTFTARLTDDFLSYVFIYMPVREKDGSFLTNFAIIRDITKWQKENLQNRIAAEKLDILTRQLGIAHFNYSPIDHTFDVFGGRDNHWVVGAPVEQVMSGIVHPEDRAKMLAAINSISDKNTKEVRFNARMVSNALHSYRTFNCEMIPQFHEDGSFAYYAGYGMDVTDHLAAMQQQREAMQDKIDTLQHDKEEAEEKEHGMGQMLSCMGHDLRSPLGTIAGFAELMKYSDDPTEKAEYYKVIKASVEQMTMLVNDILEVNRLETGRMKYRYSTFDVEDTLAEVHQAHILRFNNTRLDFCFTPRGRQILINSDLQRVIELLGNYIGNALKYTTEGSVTLSYEEVDGGIKFHVIDTGHGIAPENHEKIFNRFEMLDSEIKGNGLGLYICRSIATGLGGCVGVDSELGRGSDFWLWLPLTPPHFNKLTSTPLHL